MVGNKKREVLERYNKLCSIMKEEVCKATGKAYNKNREKERRGDREKNEKGDKERGERKKKKTTGRIVG